MRLAPPKLVPASNGTIPASRSILHKRSTTSTALQFDTQTCSKTGHHSTLRTSRFTKHAIEIAASNRRIQASLLHRTIRAHQLRRPDPILIGRIREKHVGRVAEAGGLIPPIPARHDGTRRAHGHGFNLGSFTGPVWMLPGHSCTCGACAHQLQIGFMPPPAQAARATARR